jgi:hypothetical protein
VPEPTLHVHPWHRPPLSPEERALEIERLEKETKSQKRALYLRYGFEYLVWFVVGLFLLFWSFRTTDSRYARLAFWGGIGLGDAGMLMALIRGRKEGERKGIL